MAKLMFNGMEIADVTYTSGGGGGGGLPTFTETTIATGTSGGTVTFTGDYHDYPLIYIRLTNTSNNFLTELLVTPSLLDSIFDLSSDNDLVCNEFNNNQYGTYQKTSSTVWTRAGYRNVYISEVIGLTCDNFTITETEIYNRGSYGTSNVTISGSGFLDYDLIVIASSVDGIQPNSVLTVRGLTNTDGYGIIVTPYSTYMRARVTDTEITSAPYHYVGGIKFT